MLRATTLAVLLPVLLFVTSVTTLAAEGCVTKLSAGPFTRVTEALERAIADQKMVLVCHANAQKGAAARGLTIRGNQVFMVFRNDYAVRLLAADATAGFEAPIRIYVYENPDGTATVTYRPPPIVFARYPHPEVQAIARALDPIFRAVVEAAVQARE